jgi:hypothetical protein
MTCSAIYYINFEFFGFGTFWKQALQLSCSVLRNTYRNMKFRYVYKVWIYLQILYEILFLSQRYKIFSRDEDLRLCVTERFYEINVFI